MPAKFIFSNIIGSFVFNEDYKLVDSLVFSEIEQYKNKKNYEEKFKQKYKSLLNPEGNDLYNILLFLKNKKYFSDFYEKNLIITKKLIKNSVSNDLLIIQTISSIDEIDKSLNLLTKRLREWHSLYAPEISNKVREHEKFVSLISKKPRKWILEELNINEKNSLGADLKEKDVSAILLLAVQLNNLYKLKRHYEDYLKQLEKESCPNFAEVAGCAIAAKMINHAGSLKRLAEMPSSTIQVLGAEKALFRHLKNKKRNLPPKYGIIHEHSLIQKSKKGIHGKVGRALSSKISIAVRVDYFEGKFIGDRLKNELVNKFKIDY